MGRVVLDGCVPRKVRRFAVEALKGSGWMITGKKKMGRLARVIGVGLVQLTACAGEEAGQRQAEPAAGSAEQPILFPVSPLVPFEDVDLEGPTSFSYYTPAELLMMGLPPRRCDGVMSTHGRTYSVSLEVQSAPRPTSIFRARTPATTARTSTPIITQLTRGNSTAAAPYNSRYHPEKGERRRRA